MGKPDQGAAAAEGARRATGDAAGNGRGGRFSARRKRETVLRLLRGEVCQERPAPDGHAPRAAVRRAATITARAGHRTRPVVCTPDAPPARPPL